MDDPPHTITGAGTTRLGWKEVNQSSMGLGWHAQIGASLGMKDPRGSGVQCGSGMGNNEGWQSTSELYSV